MKLMDVLWSLDCREDGLRPSAYGLAATGVKYLNDPKMIKEFYKEFVQEIQQHGMLPGFDKTLVKGFLKDPGLAADYLLAAELHGKQLSNDKVRAWLDSLPNVLASYIAQDFISTYDSIIKGKPGEPDKNP